MNDWGFILAAYGVTALGTIGLTVSSWLSMRRAERRIEMLRDDR